MAPLKTKSVGLLTVPSWTSAETPPETCISYQAIFVRPPAPATVCWVQMPLVGSPTACVIRPSPVSRTFDVPDCGAGAGAPYVATLTSTSWCRTPVLSRCHTAILLGVELEGS